MRHPPEPLQKPSVPQVAAPASVHWLSGSWPVGTLVQVPIVPASAQDWHRPVQLVAQQTLCEQLLLAHSVPVVHAAPLIFFEQTPPLHTFGLLQSPSTMHEILHAVAPHWYGSQDDVAAAWQTPPPLHVRAAAAVMPVQLGPAHCVPAA